MGDGQVIYMHDGPFSAQYNNLKFKIKRFNLLTLRYYIVDSSLISINFAYSGLRQDAESALRYCTWSPHV